MNTHSLLPPASCPLPFFVTRLGSMSKYKGYDQILHALVKVRSYLPNVHFILAGKGDDIPRVKALVTNLNLQDCVTGV
ncbi:glycosyltransferase [Nostoc sp.]|uniref:glycosyltransferase n=1 Tax=Nostoc sp. TaxID=1180 RepID=UPI003FA5B434